MKDREQPFAAFVLNTLTHRSTELAQWWAERAQPSIADSGEPDSDRGAAEWSRDRQGQAERLIRTLLTAAAEGTHRHNLLLQTGTAIGVDAHRRSVSLHLMLKEIDLLGTLVLRVAEDVAAEYPANASGRAGLAVARRISGATSQLRLAATMGYTQTVEDELRKRYRAIRHSLRNPLGTIKSAVALLTDESAPAEMRESSRVRAMVVRNTSSLDQMISEVLGDTAARLHAFEIDTSREPPADLPADSPTEVATSGREERDDVARTRQRPDLKPGTF
jgi:K+-sensing histidine kinase KdpD